MKQAITLITIALILTLANPVAAHGTKSTSLSFTNTPLIRPDGNSEPELSIGPDGTTVYVALSWTQFFTNTWKAGFGQVPVFQGAIDANLANNVGGGGDADVDIGSTGTLHASTLIFFFNPQTRITQLGVSAITCPNADTSNTFQHVTDPITGQAGVTSNSTFDNDQGKLVADSFSHNVYTIWAGGAGGLQKAKTANFNNIYVAVSSDMGKTWTPHLVFSGTVNVALNNVFPALAVDPLSGTLYAGWSNAHQVFISKSTDQGQTWTSPLAVNTSPANTAVFPWIAARGNTVDFVYYGTNAASKDDPTAVWNVYMAQSTDSGSHFTQSTVTAHPNHVGVICTNGTGCSPGTRNLLDLFQDAIDPLNGLAAIIYTDDTLTTQSNGSPLPQVTVAFQTA